MSEDSSDTNMHAQQGVQIPWFRPTEPVQTLEMIVRFSFPGLCAHEGEL